MAAALHLILTFKLFIGRLMKYQHRYGDIFILYLIQGRFKGRREGVSPPC